MFRQSTGSDRHLQNSVDPDLTPQNATSDPGLQYLPLSHQFLDILIGSKHTEPNLRTVRIRCHGEALLRVNTVLIY